MEKQNHNHQSIYSKEDFSWHYISFYLDSLIGSVPIEDEEFIRLFQMLQDYVETKVFKDNEGELVDIFVVIERKPSERKPSK